MHQWDFQRATLIRKCDKAARNKVNRSERFGPYGCVDVKMITEGVQNDSLLLLYDLKSLKGYVDMQCRPNLHFNYVVWLNHEWMVTDMIWH